MASPVSTVPSSAVEVEAPKVLEAALPTVGLVDVASVLEVVALAVIPATAVPAEFLVAQPNYVPHQLFEIRSVVRWHFGVPLGGGPIPMAQREVLPTTVAGSVAMVEVVGCVWPSSPFRSKC